MLDVALGLLGLVAGDGSDDGVLLALKAVGGALSVALSLGSGDFRFPSGVLLLASSGP